MRIRIPILLTLLFGVSALFAQSFAPGHFHQLSRIGGEMSRVFTLAQDSERFVWLGTDNGLVRYDGHRFETFRHDETDTTSLCNDLVNTLLFDPATGHLLVGTDRGASLYDSRRNRFTRLTGVGDRHVKAFLRTGDTLWIGTTSGLLRCDRTTGRTALELSTRNGRHAVPSEHIACCRKIGSDIWVGAYNYLYRLGADGSLDIHPLPGTDGNGNTLLLDITADASHPGRLWLGTERGLVHYDPKTRTAHFFLAGTPVKNFLRQTDGTLWIGTDNGLYIKDTKNRFTHLRHEVGNDRSLSNNVIWAIFRDDRGDIWLGSDHGVSIAATAADFAFHSLRRVTGDDDGLDVRIIRCDPAGNLWLGGMNGLIRYDAAHAAHTWYKSDSGAEGTRLSHNKVRGLHPDGQQLWITTDGGLDRYDYGTHRITRFHIAEASGHYFSDWMYAIEEDRFGRLWIGTYDGGLFVVGKRKLPENGGSVTADAHFSKASQPAIPGNIVLQLALAADFCVAITDGGTVLIDLDLRTVTPLRIPEAGDILTLAGDGSEVWIGTSRGIYRLGTDRIPTLIPGFSRPVRSIIPLGGRICVLSGAGFSVYDTGDGNWSHRDIDENPLLCGTTDGNRLYFGSVDGYFEFADPDFRIGADSARVAVTSLLLDNRPVEVGESYNGTVILPEHITRTRKITLQHNQNSFAVEFSSFRYTRSEEHFAYRLRGFDDKWQQTTGNRAVFINIPPGEYRFEVCAARPDGSPSPTVAPLEVRIRPVWYATTGAFLVYGLIIAGLIVWVLYSVRMRHQLQIEHMEREKTLKLVEMKSAFFANLSHEFKSPLSSIIRLTGRMITSEADALRTRELETLRVNAEKMHLLIDQMLDYNENDSLSLFIPAATSLRELARGVFERFAPAFARKEINARFVADEIGYIFMVDRIRMEAVLKHLLSNALKHTPRGGSVLMTVAIGSQTDQTLQADIRIEDTGCGIREEELPFLFNPYHRPAQATPAGGGSPEEEGGGDRCDDGGIDLHRARKIVEMHKGQLTVTSAVGRGSCFTIRLSTLKADSFVIQPASAEEYSLHNLSEVWQHSRKPILLLVEGNPAIRDLIVASLGSDYTFCPAADCDEGLRLLENEKIDLVVAEIDLPGRDGLEMSRTIRNSLKTAFLPIILLAERNDMQTRMQSFEYADAFITKPFNLNYLNSRIIQLLIKHEHYLERMKRQQMLTPQVETLESADEKFLQEIAEIVNKHLGDPEFSASTLCAESRYGSKQIYRKIKQLTGMSIVEFIRDMRLQKAALYLSQRKLSVTEIMYMVGFTTASYFSKCFKAKFGVTPSEY